MAGVDRKITAEGSMQNPPKGGKPSPQVIHVHMPTLREAPSAQQAVVSRSDLGVLADALRVLESLNNPLVSPTQLANTVAQMPKLSARVTREFHRVFMNREIPSVADQLKALGNKRFEEILYNYLEDLTMAHGSSEEP